MDTEFHYWITGIVAHEAGFREDEASIIAYSSEYVDENDVSITVKDRSSSAKYVNFVSQTMNILQPKDTLMRIYPIFHFIPGDPAALSARRRDGKMHLFNATPNNQYANDLFGEAFKAPEEVRLYRIGIATHGFADTWAHQNFTGWHDSFNAMGVNVLPNIGHADAKHHPDWVGHRWVDIRLVEGDINNNHRFLSAAEGLFKYYCDYLVARGRYQPAARPSWGSLQQKLIDAMGNAVAGDLNYYREERIGRYRSLAPWLPKEFDESAWFDDAIETDVIGLHDSEDGSLSRFTIFKDKYYWREDREKEKTDWYRFQTAVKDHERFAIKLLSPLFDQIGLDLGKA
jgi:hypothetical protein